MKTLHRLRFFLSIVYRPDWFTGDRIKPSTAWEVACIYYQKRSEA